MEMNEIEKFDNGLDVERIIFEIQEKKDQNLIKESFEKAMKLDFLVPYKDQENQFITIKTKDKGTMFPAYSNYTEFLKSELPMDKVRIMSYPDLQKMVIESAGQIKGIIVNPHGKSLTFEHHQNNNVEHTDNQKLHLLKPNYFSEAFGKELVNIFKENEKVYKAYFLWGMRDLDIAPHAFIIIDFDGDKEEFLPKVAERLKPLLKKGETIEFAKADFNLLKIAEKTSDPIYVK